MSPNIRAIVEARQKQIIANLAATPVEVLQRAKQQRDIGEHNAKVEKRKAKRG